MRQLTVPVHFIGEPLPSAACDVLDDYRGHRIRVRLPGVDARDVAGRDAAAGYAYRVMLFVLHGPQPDDVVWVPEWRSLFAPEWLHVTRLYPRVWDYERLVDLLHKRRTEKRDARAAQQDMEARDAAE